MKKKLISILLTVVMVASILPLSILGVFAENPSGTCGTNLTWELNGGTLTISGEGKMSDFSGKSSTPWASYRTSITNVVIEDGVTSIGRYAFRECTNLTSVIIPDGVEKIGIYAFYGCGKLNNVVVPASVDSETIDYTVFYGCNSMTKMTIGCSKVTNDILASNVEELIFSDSVESIGQGAFVDRKKIKSITVSEGNPNFSSENGVLFNKAKTILIFYPSQKPETEFKVPESVRVIGESAFQQRCNNLKKVEIGKGVELIKANALVGCGCDDIQLHNGEITVEDQIFFQRDYSCVTYLGGKKDNVVIKRMMNRYYFKGAPTKEEVRAAGGKCFKFLTGRWIDQYGEIYCEGDSISRYGDVSEYVLHAEYMGLFKYIWFLITEK